MLELSGKGQLLEPRILQLPVWMRQPGAMHQSDRADQNTAGWKDSNIHTELPFHEKQ